MGLFVYRFPKQISADELQNIAKQTSGKITKQILIHILYKCSISTSPKQGIGDNIF